MAASFHLGWLWLVAPLVAVVYTLISLRVGDTFPFSSYRMYASTARRTEGAVIVFLADGADVPVDGFDRFAGIDPSTIYPKGLACSLEWQVHELRRWLVTHAASPGDPPGPVRAQIGWRILRVDAAGRIDEQLRVVAEGSAFRRERGR